MAELKPTAANAWQSGALEALPSGNVARLRPVGIEHFLRLPEVPNPILELLFADEPADAAAPKKSPLDLARLYHQVADLMICAAFVEPKVTPDGAGASVPLAAVSAEDRDYVLRRYQTVVTLVEPFRPLEKAGVGGLPDGGDAEAATE